MALPPTPCARQPQWRIFRVAAALAVPLLGAAVVMGACTGGSESAAPKTNQGPFCPPAPCEVGTICMQPGASNCNGEWYCWADHAWYCAPPDSGPPPDVGAALIDDGGADAADEAAADAAGSADASDAADATDGG
jgi:hypothetical protein